MVARLTLFLEASGGGCTPLTSRLLSSLDTNDRFRWMLMKPGQARRGARSTCLSAMEPFQLKTTIQGEKKKKSYLVLRFPSFG